MSRALLAGAAVFAIGCRSGAGALPADVTGTLVFVSDRTGIDALYTRRLPDGPDVRLTFLSEPLADPALSPDGQQVAFSVAGRIACVAVATGDVRYLSLGIAARDAEPAWHPDGRRLVISSRAGDGEPADLFLLEAVDVFGESARRQRLTQTPADEGQPVVAPDGGGVVFVREENLFRLEIANGSLRKLTRGFRKARQPRVLGPGRLLFLWSEGKQFGIDSIGLDGRDRRPLQQGSTYYRKVAPSPDGRYLVATNTYDLDFRPSEAITRRRNEELRLLDARGRELAALTPGWRHSDHSAVWGR